MTDREYEFRTAKDFAEMFPKHAEDLEGAIEFNILGIAQDLIYLAKFNQISKVEFLLGLMDIWANSGILDDLDDKFN